MNHQEIVATRTRCLELALSTVNVNNARVMIGTPIPTKAFTDEVLVTAELYFNWITQE